MLLQLTYQPETTSPGKLKDKLRKKEARREIRRWLQKYKGRGCQNCPEKRIATLDFHHLNQSEKRIEINEAVRMRWSRKSIQKEIDKCILICANCHRCEHDNSYRNSSVSGVYSISDNDLYSNVIFYAKGVRS